MRDMLQYRVEYRRRRWPWVTILGAVMGPVNIWLLFTAFGYPPFRELFWIAPTCFIAGLLVTVIGSRTEGRCMNRPVWRMAQVTGLVTNGIPLLFMVFALISSWLR